MPIGSVVTKVKTYSFERLQQFVFKLTDAAHNRFCLLLHFLLPLLLMYGIISWSDAGCRVVCGGCRQNRLRQFFRHVGSEAVQRNQNKSYQIRTYDRYGTCSKISHDRKRKTPDFAATSDFWNSFGVRSLPPAAR